MTTGWAHQEDGIITAGQIQAQNVWDLLERLNPEEIVYESFQKRPDKHADLTPVEVIGRIKEWAEQNVVRLHAQTYASVKFYWTDKRLRALGLYQVGKKHANDALRHLCKYIGLTH